MTGAIVNLICHLTVSHCDDSRRIPRTLVVGVCQKVSMLIFLLSQKGTLNTTFTSKWISGVIDLMSRMGLF